MDIGLNMEHLAQKKRIKLMAIPKNCCYFAAENLFTNY